MTREYLQNFKIGDAQLPKEVIDAIMAENGRDIVRIRVCAHNDRGERGLS